MEDMATAAPRNAQPGVIWIARRIRLVLDARLVKVVAANGAGVYRGGEGARRALGMCTGMIRPNCCVSFILKPAVL